MTDVFAASPSKVSDRYEVTQPAIGQGGIGVVYKAHDTKTGRLVALKTVSGELDSAALHLFEREWNILARISHPNIVEILDTGEYADDGIRKPFFVMPLLSGATLDELIRTSHQSLTVERTVEIIIQACRGLQAAHDQNLVHRDLKPSNIFVTDDGTVKIIDFGVVHLADLRTVTTLKGTPIYMAPEQLDGKPATALSDTFSLGVICYEALTGRKPLSRRTEAEVFEAIHTYVPPPASEINTAVNQLVSRTVHKAMAKQPWHRFPTAREFGDTLQKAIRNEPIERFDRARIQPRIDRIKKAHAEGDYQFANEILTELESEGHMDSEVSMLRFQLDQDIKTKTIRQLLYSARTRMEEDEYPLALQKIQDVLNLDPSNVDATALRYQIEEQRTAKQIENLFGIVAQHLGNEDYGQARQTIEEILNIDESNVRARELHADVDRTEQELARRQKQKIHDAQIAEINRRVESEASLDEKYNILNEAVERFPNETYFKSLLKTIEERRDLVNSIVSRARYYEERGELNDAAAQWNILNHIYPDYAGLEGQFKRLATRREEQIAEQAKPRWVDHIDAQLPARESSQHPRAVKPTRAEYSIPDEPHHRNGVAEPGLSHAEEAKALMDEGQRLVGAGQLEEGMQMLRRADRLDDRNPAVRAALRGALVQRARQCMASDWRTAEPLVKEVLQMDPGNPFARAMASLIADHQRQEAVDKILFEATTLQDAADTEGALAKVERGLLKFLHDSRLTQFQQTLQPALLDSAKEETVVAVAAGAGADTASAPVPPQPALPPLARPPVTRRTGPPKLLPPPVASPSFALTKLPKQRRRRRSRRSEKRRINLIIAAAVAVILLSLLALILTLGRRSAQPERAAVAPVPKGFPTHRPAASIPAPPPVLPGMRLYSGLGSGAFLFDREPLQLLQEGGAVKENIQSGEHSVSIHDRYSADVFDFSFVAKPGELSIVDVPPKGTVPGVVVSSLGSNAIVYATPNVKGGAEGTPLAVIPPEGDKRELPSRGGLHYVFESADGKRHAIVIDVSSASAVNVILSGAPEAIPFIIQANVPDATVVINGHELKTGLVGGVLSVRRPPGTYHVLVKADNYEPSAVQDIKLEEGNTPPPLQFTLTRTATAVNLATLVIDGAPPSTDVLLDGSSIGTVDDGTFKKDLQPGTHTITLKKAEYLDSPHYHQFVAGETFTISAADMKPFGTLMVSVTPTTAHITYQRNGDPQPKSLENNKQQPLLPGDYTVKAEADGFLPDTQLVTVASGAVVPYSAGLKPSITNVIKQRPADLFEDGRSWVFNNPDGWWIFGEKGFSFMRQLEGTFMFTLLKDTQGLLSEKVKKYEFVADYVDDENKVLYTLDPHHLTRRVFAEGKELKDGKSDIPITVGDIYKLIVQISQETIIVRVNGVMDVSQRPGTRGKFGFVNEVVLIPR